MAVRPHAEGKSDSGEQDLVLGFEPRQGLPVIAGSLGGGATAWAGRG